MRCERCWAERGLAPVPLPDEETVQLCDACRSHAPADPLLLRTLYLRFASRKELLRHYGARDEGEALRRWAREAGLPPTRAADLVRRERSGMGLFQRLPQSGPRERVAPFGYRFEAGSLVLAEYEAEVVRRVFRLYLRGGSLVEVADALNEDRVPTRRGRRWHPSTVRFLLRNPLYAGYVRRAGFVRQGSHPPLVTTREHREVQRRLSQRCRRPSQKAERAAPL